MKKPSRKTVTKPKTHDSFEAVAKRLECDMDEGRFKEKLGKIARAKPRAGAKER